MYERYHFFGPPCIIRISGRWHCKRLSDVTCALIIYVAYWFVQRNWTFLVSRLESFNLSFGFYFVCVMYVACSWTFFRCDCKCSYPSLVRPVLSTRFSLLIMCCFCEQINRLIDWLIDWNEPIIEFCNSYGVVVIRVGPFYKTSVSVCVVST